MTDFMNRDGFHSEISEWWDHDGHYHEGEPTEDELLNDAVQVTGHIWDEEGNDLYFTSFSDGGWNYDEIADDFEDAADHYIPGK